MDSPCHHCAKCPCKEHDTCGDYLEFRAELDRLRREYMKYSVVREYVNSSIDKRRRKEHYKKP